MMLGHVLRRLAASVAILVGVSVLVFGAIRLVPGDPVSVMLGVAEISDPEAVAEYRRAYGLEDPLPIQYWVWASHVARADFGRSVATQESVTAIVGRRLSATLLLGAVAVVLAMVSGLLWGVTGAYLRGAPGAMLRWSTLFFMAVPSFSIGLALAYVFAVWLRVLPASGMQRPVDGGDPLDMLAHTVLPAIALAVYPAAMTARITQASIDELRNEDFVRTARAAGIPSGRIALMHVLPNALLPVMTNGGVMVGSMLTAAVFVETVFAWPGIGTMMVAAVHGRDYPLVQSGALVVAATFVLLSWLIDSLYVLADPRIGRGALRE